VISRVFEKDHPEGRPATSFLPPVILPITSPAPGPCRVRKQFAVGEHNYELPNSGLRLTTLSHGKSHRGISRTPWWDV